MQEACVLTQNDIKEILSDYFKIPVNQIITSKYSFIVIGLDNTMLLNFSKEEKENV